MLNAAQSWHLNSRPAKNHQKVQKNLPGDKWGLPIFPSLDNNRCLWKKKHEKELYFTVDNWLLFLKYYINLWWEIDGNTVNQVEKTGHSSNAAC